MGPWTNLSEMRQIGVCSAGYNPPFGGLNAFKIEMQITRLGEVVSVHSSDSKYIGGMTSSTYKQLMTNINTTSSKMPSIKEAFGLVALALSPLAVIIGIEAVNVPAAEAYTTRCSTDYFGNVTCRTSQY